MRTRQFSIFYALKMQPLPHIILSGIRSVCQHLQLNSRLAFFAYFFNYAVNVSQTFFKKNDGSWLLVIFIWFLFANTWYYVSNLCLRLAQSQHQANPKENQTCPKQKFDFWVFVNIYKQNIAQKNRICKIVYADSFRTKSWL